MDARALCESFGLPVGQVAMALCRTAQDSREVALMGMQANRLLGAAESGGELALTWVVVPPGQGPPLHRHRCTELVAVVAGALEYTGWDGEALVTRRVEAGEVASSPPGAPHCFVAADGPATIAVAMSPASGETVFRNLGVPTDGTAAEATPGTDLERVDAAAPEVPAGTPATQFAPVGSGERSWLLGDTVALLWDAPLPASLHELAPGAGAPLHVQVADEAFIVLDGALEFTSLADGAAQTSSVPVGSVVYVPAGVGEAYVNALDRPCRFLLLCATAEPHGFFRAAGLPLGQAAAPQRAPAPSEVEAVIGAALAAGITFPTLP